ncbi:hypothetical protein H17ap60334_01531 [Thermosipho africanus H17ap60334]|jgi:hypothetical protein|uniref:Uncharacterized protein n=1 Tax=Thermosipho africanus (strain TCF52B) TaxID=484019 RepID=B7IH38_THEAB|nr:hypothetical protein [Thermosipho africanus]ACJ75402.1 hypothetical protein THA_943 [Thermosipho africanus TCF52B]EKF50124.1 hypothetical protein H17ap60334_01531 [Thermosipho africanus H17ap60334]MDK2840002.1 hypothetical protein [Thermosipho sp. (in: thermotogales)]
MKSLKKQFFFISLFLILSFTILFGVLLTYTLYKVETKQLKELIYQKTKQFLFL